ncbi:MAG: DUF4189 domain-containing protein [Alphaproteobacteria bacterium]|nr:DUF4189 domain-containing protein [Alphaproteobacteria bacterium]
MRKLISAFAGSLVLLVGIGVAQAQTPQYWAAYAYDATNGRWGLAWGRTDRQATINDALSRCQTPGCQVGHIMLARCVAVAQGTQRPPGFGIANDSQTASLNALNFCRRGAAGSTCEVAAVRCGT